jgi:prepilin-type N-terminal cleavage/methylation domain-containing protein
MAGQDQRGFSLLELLVTLFVIVLVTSMVTLNISSGGRDIEWDAQVRDLADTAAYALDEAQMLGVNYGLQLVRMEEDGETVYGYRWRELKPEGWREPASGKEVFQQRQFPRDLELQLELEDLPVAEFPLLGGDKEEAPPQIVLYASGEATEGAIEVLLRESGELLWRIEWDLLGRFRLLRRGEEEDLEAEG